MEKIIDTKTGVVLYKIDFSSKGSKDQAKEDSGGGSCAGVGCSACHKDRNWFAGPVVGCSCTTQATPSGYCNHSTSSGPSWWEILLAILPYLFIP